MTEAKASFAALAARIRQRRFKTRPNAWPALEAWIAGLAGQVPAPAVARR